jgi:ABC-type Na+ transport system ATPase subunit NatA
VRYKSFRIQNFKGIKDTTVTLAGVGGAAVFAFVGLNESGKTTVLEAIHSFSPDDDASELVGGAEGTKVPFKNRVPRHMISNFSGEVSVTATVIMTDEDMAEVTKELRGRNLEMDAQNLSREIVFRRYQKFKDGDFVGAHFTMLSPVKVKSRGTGKLRPLADQIRIIVRDVFYSFTPDIAYFPTFVFDFPSTIFLTERGGRLDRFYRTVFQDILDADGRGHTIDKDIIRRVRADALQVAWVSFFAMWSKHDDRAKIDQVMDRASSAVTRTIFGRWDEIFKEKSRGKEVSISYETMEGETEDARGQKTKTNEHDVSIKFQIKDGSRRFAVNDRSLGFRWFFAFMLFTQFRVARSKSRPLLFLFDEPASNLHAAAQQKLIECFPAITKGDHTLVYTTHSHYMIEPKWLEQTFIVTNRADAPSGSVLDDISLDDESLDIKISSYRSFVNEHPNQTSYFQPILDRLEVVPSKFDMKQSSLIIEGKSDYYILKYAEKALGKTDLPLLPGLGAGTLGALAAMHVGWNLNFLFVLDGDRQGKSEKKGYIVDYGIPSNRIVTLDEVVKGVTVIEDLLDDEALLTIQNELQLKSSPTKSQIRRFFQERLASLSIDPLSAEFVKRSTTLLDELASRLHVGIPKPSN